MIINLHTHAGGEQPVDAAEAGTPGAASRSHSLVQQTIMPEDFLDEIEGLLGSTDWEDAAPTVHYTVTSDKVGHEDAILVGSPLAECLVGANASVVVVLGVSAC